MSARVVSASVACGRTSGCTRPHASSTDLATTALARLPESATSAVITIRPALNQNPSPSITVTESFTSFSRSRRRRAACARTLSSGIGTFGRLIETAT